MSDALREVAALVQRESGVVLREAHLPALRAAIARTVPGLDADGVLAALTKPGAAALVEQLIDEVTIKETFFFRHRNELDGVDLRETAARAAQRGESRVRVWSAGCASGEEAYTLAILALEAFAPSTPPVDILGTDIAASALSRAETGRYGARAIRHVDEDQRRRWLRPAGRGHEVGDAVRRLVRFRRHNLLGDPMPPPGEAAFDVIVCRNVLLYFEPAVVRATVARLRGALAPGGVLVLGAADRLTGGVEPAPGVRAVRRERRRHRVVEPRRTRPPAGPRRPAVVAVAAAPPPVPTAALDVGADFERGVTALAAGDASTAVEALRRVLYLEPDHVAAAFQLARAHDAGGDKAAARRAYWRALALLDGAGQEVAGVARRDLETVCRTRLAALERVA